MSKRRAHARHATRRLPASRALVLLLVLTGLVFSSWYPMRRYFAVRAQIHSLRAEDAALDREAGQLDQQKRDLQADEAVEQLAREEYGMVRPGEVPFVVANSPAPSPQAVPRVDTPGTQPRGPSLLSRWWHALSRTAHAIR